MQVTGGIGSKLILASHQLIAMLTCDRSLLNRFMRMIKEVDQLFISDLWTRYQLYKS